MSTDFTAPLARAEAALARALPGPEAQPAQLAAAMRYACVGGKRLRALMVYAAGELAGALPEHCDAPAAAVELVHAYSLVHDDLPAMDNDDLRRGRATVHKAFDEATAILAGDALQTLAFEVLVSPSFSAPNSETRLAWLQALAAGTGLAGMTGGQQLDLAAEHSPLTLSALETLHQKKTGALITASLSMGLAAGRASASQQAALARFGWALGLAYQVQDDVLDVEGSAQSLGKTPGKDAVAGKSTYVSLMGLAAAKARAASLFAEAEAAIAGLPAPSLHTLLQRIASRSS